MKSDLFVILALISALFCGGCQTRNVEQAAWIASNEFRICEELARVALKENRNLYYSRGRPATDSIVQVENHFGRLITVYLPVEVDNGGVTCAYYEFVAARSDTRSHPYPLNPYMIANNSTNSEFLLVQHGSVLPNGEKIPRCGRRLDPSRRYYVNNGDKLTIDSDAVLLRDLNKNESRVLIPPAGGNYYSQPWFGKDGEILYYHSNALWRLNLERNQNTKLLTLTNNIDLTKWDRPESLFSPDTRKRTP